MYDWIETTFNVSGSVTQAIAVILALAVVLLLFSLFIFVLKRLTGANVSTSRSRQPRIAVMDSATVDTRRRLVLVRRDNVEHLLLVGGPSDVVVEQNIVRNAPLSASRPSVNQVVAHSGSSAIKAPMAPGPDIPARPDDTAASTEPVSIAPPAMPAQAPEPQASVSPMPAPVTARSSVEDEPVAPPSKDTSPPKREPSLAIRPTKPEDKPETPPSRNRATDLLRAATQNGFNRAVSKPTRTEPDPAADADKQEEPIAKVPEVKPEPVASSLETETRSETKTASPLKNLTRPFTPRDRPSYGSHSITPPASGPAARAKTALLKPVDAATETQKIEPVVGAPEIKTANTESGETKAPTISVDQTAQSPEKNRPDPKIAAPVVVAAEPAPASAAEKTAETPNPEAPDAASTSTEPAAVPDTKDNSPETQSAGKEASPQDIKLDLGLGDLIEDAPADTVRTETGSKGSSAVDGEDTKQGPSQKQEQQAKSTTPTAQGLADKNPIEEEMAKLLDELGGQPN